MTTFEHKKRGGMQVDQHMVVDNQKPLDF